MGSQASFEMQAGRTLVLEALRHLSSASELEGSRIALLHNPMSRDEIQYSLLAVALEAALQLPSRRAKLPGFVQAALSSSDLLAASEAANTGKLCRSLHSMPGRCTSGSCQTK